MAIIYLTQGGITFVDDEDYDYLNQFNWRSAKMGYSTYAVRDIYKEGKWQQKSIHCVLLQPSEGMIVDHKDGNGLNNRRNNIRICTRQQNLFNQQKTRGTSRYKGVAWYKQTKKWRTQIKYNGKMYHLGYFDTEEEAALAYNQQAKQFFGDFARLNEVDK